MKALHIVYQSLPNISGSSIRTRDIVMSQKEIGLDPIVVSGPFQNGKEQTSKCDLINNVKHYRTYNNKPGQLVIENKTPLRVRFMKSFSIFRFYRETKKIVEIEKPDILHAHAMFFCAIVAILLGKKFNLPVCYEIRSLWEEREKTDATTIIKRLQPKFLRFVETLCMKHVDKVIVINENLKKEISSRGIKNIDIIPNAVNLDLINLAEEPKKPYHKVSFGYVGSVSPIEGLDLLAKAWKEIEIKGYKNKFHVYGDGTFFKDLESLVRELNLNNFHLNGKISSDLVSDAYKTIDVIVNPRLKSKISDTVTPLKPLEAMGYNKMVIASNVGGMKELIRHNETGLLFEADSQKELEKILLSVISTGTNKTIINNAQSYVSKEKSWKTNATNYSNIYKNQLSKLI